MSEADEPLLAEVARNFKDLINEIIADIGPCTCSTEYTSRKLRDPVCANCDNYEWIQKAKKEIENFERHCN